MPLRTPMAFISYSREDSEFALRLARDLKAAGALVWLDQLDIQPGHAWDSSIEKALLEATRMLLVLSPASVKSENVRNEISFALEEKKIIVPVLHRDCAIPLQLHRIQRVDFRTDYAGGLRALLLHLDVQPAVASDNRAEATPPTVPIPAIAASAIHRAPAKRIARVRIAWILAGVLVLLAAAASLRFAVPHAKALTEKDTIVLADFANSTGDPVIDGTLRQGMTVQLEQSPFLSLISDERIQKTLALMAQPADARLTPAIGREICQRTGSAAVLDGSIAPLGTAYVLGLRAIDCHTGDVLDAEQVQAARKEDVLNALSQVASNFRTKIGESLATVKQYDTPLAEATTPSIEALKAYSAAWKVSTTIGSATAVPLYKHVVDLDPQFAMAYAMLGRMYGDIGESSLAAQSTGKAYELRDRASDRERFFIVASRDTVVTGNLRRAQQTCEAWAQTYPRDVNAHGFLSAMIYPVLGRWDKALEESKESVEVDPDAGFTYNNLFFSYLALGRTVEAEAALERAAERKLEIPDYLVDRYQIAFLKGDTATMELVAAQALKTPGAEDTVAGQQAFALAYSGRLQQARAMSRHAVEVAQQSGQRERAAGLEAGSAVMEGFLGEADAARRNAAAVLKLSNGRDGQYGAAFALALAGDFAQAQALADDLEKRFPEDTEVRTNYLPGVRALLALHRKDAAKAIDLLQINVPFELGSPPSGFPGGYGLLYPVYVRGEAYLALHQGVQAAAEFQKILDHPGIVLADPVAAIASLQLARAYAVAGDTAKAKTAYQSFLTLWKDADPDIPILLQARAEFAKL